MGTKKCYFQCGMLGGTEYELCGIFLNFTNVIVKFSIPFLT
uniref:Uncharacterized protein n=1 Tax=Anguilla anguilla TaxID=7936 RepID=A0A0E9XKM0_ANGAN